MAIIIPRELASQLSIKAEIVLRHKSVQDAELESAFSCETTKQSNNKERGVVLFKPSGFWKV